MDQGPEIGGGLVLFSLLCWLGMQLGHTSLAGLEQVNLTLSDFKHQFSQP